MSVIGKNIIFIGFFISILGFILYALGDKLSFLWNLPGDIKYESENFQLFIPITSMFIISLFLSLIINLIAKFLK